MKIFTYIKESAMGFWSIFKDDNTYNEKSIVGFAAFAMMVISLLVDIVTGTLGKEMPINEFIFDGFLYIALGAFGIAEVGKIWGKKGGE